MKRKLNQSQFTIKVNQSGVTHNSIILVLFFIFAAFILIRISSSHVSADTPKITSGLNGYCLDVKDNADINGAKIDSWSCNNTQAQVWYVNGVNLIHDSKYCLSVSNNSISDNSKIELDDCSNSPGQVWLRDQNGFFNPNSTMCLSSSSSDPTSQLFISSCDKLSSTYEKWSSSDKNDGSYYNCSGNKGDKVACAAEKEWSTWQSVGSNHMALLNHYTDGAPYEEWCADFISYVYKEADYPFTHGETDGWDENIASNIINMGFTVHLASSGYIPKPGDVAFFNYNGGHVEIVISGGSKPTFIYGNSATIDPSTGNGEMMSNTIVNDGPEGQLVYYLSPN